MVTANGRRRRGRWRHPSTTSSKSPPFFYLVSVLALLTDTAGPAFLALAWGFVLSRIAHAAIHVTSNDVKLRGPAYIIGVFILIAMWIMLAVQVMR